MMNHAVAAEPPVGLAEPVPSLALPYAAIILLAAGLFALRLAGPSDLAVGSQDRTASYVLDILQNGRWICPYDATGGVMSKPPLHPWLGAMLSHAMGGRFDRFALALPAALATLLTALLICRVAGRYFGAEAALLAGMSYLLSPLISKQIALVRPDASFSLAIAIAAFAALEAWRTGRKWTIFWLAAAAATLSKGPLGLVIAASGLLAVLWERYGGHRLPLSGRIWPGLVLYVVLTGGWFLLAWLQAGQALIDELFLDELVGHAIADNKGRRVGHGFYKPMGYLLWHFAPWSILCFVGCWRIICRPAAEDRIRRFERFVFCWLATGIVLFSFAGHQRPDHLMVLVPAAALLAGRELVMLHESVPQRILRPAYALAFAGMAGLLTYYYHVDRPKDMDVHQTRAVQRSADLLLEEPHPVVHVDSLPALRLFMRQVNANVTLAQAAELLRREQPVIVTVFSLNALREATGPGVDLYEWERWPARGEAEYVIVSNRPAEARWVDLPAIHPRRKR